VTESTSSELTARASYANSTCRFLSLYLDTHRQRSDEVYEVVSTLLQCSEWETVLKVRPELMPKGVTLTRTPNAVKEVPRRLSAIARDLSDNGVRHKKTIVPEDCASMDTTTRLVPSVSEASAEPLPGDQSMTLEASAGRRDSASSVSAPDVEPRPRNHPHSANLSAPGGVMSPSRSPSSDSVSSPCTEPVLCVQRNAPKGGADRLRRGSVVPLLSHPVREETGTPLKPKVAEPERRRSAPVVPAAQREQSEHEPICGIRSVRLENLSPCEETSTTFEPKVAEPERRRSAPVVPAAQREQSQHEPTCGIRPVRLENLAPLMRDMETQSCDTGGVNESSSEPRCAALPATQFTSVQARVPLSHDRPRVSAPPNFFIGDKAWPTDTSSGRSMLDDLRGDAGTCLQDGVLCRLEKCETTIREVHGTVEEVQRAVKDLAVPIYLEEFAEMRTRVSEVWNIFKEFASALPSDGQHSESKVMQAAMPNNAEDLHKFRCRVSQARRILLKEEGTMPSSATPVTEDVLHSGPLKDFQGHAYTEIESSCASSVTERVPQGQSDKDVFRTEDFLREGSQFDRQVYALQEDISRTLARMKEFNAEQARGDKKALEDLCSLRGRIFRKTCEVPECASARLCSESFDEEERVLGDFMRGPSSFLEPPIWPGLAARDDRWRVSAVPLDGASVLSRPAEDHLRDTTEDLKLECHMQARSISSAASQWTSPRLSPLSSTSSGRRYSQGQDVPKDLPALRKSSGCVDVSPSLSTYGTPGAFSKTQKSEDGDLVKNVRYLVGDLPSLRLGGRL